MATVAVAVTAVTVPVVVPRDGQLRAPLRLDLLPDRLDQRLLDVHGNSPADWSSWIVANGGGRFVTVAVGTPVPGFTGEADQWTG